MFHDMESCHYGFAEYASGLNTRLPGRVVFSQAGVTDFHVMATQCIILFCTHFSVSKK